MINFDAALEIALAVLVYYIAGEVFATLMGLPRRGILRFFCVLIWPYALLVWASIGIYDARRSR